MYSLSSSQPRRGHDVLFTLWAGGAAFMAYMLVYALRKPFTAAAFDGLTAWGMDYKVVATVAQILGYLAAKGIGIKLISELRPARRLPLFVAQAVAAELALVAFALVPAPWNVAAMCLNGLALGCMWGVIFSYLEGRRTTDVLGSLLAVSIVVGSGAAKSAGLWLTVRCGVSELWMPALIGGVALPVLLALGWTLQRLPAPSAADVAARAARVPLGPGARRKLVRDYAPILLPLFAACLLLTVLRDVKEDFLVRIVDMSGQSPWLFARVDSVVSLLILGLFAAMTLVRDHRRALIVLLCTAMTATAAMTVSALRRDALGLGVAPWLFVQSMGIYVAYLAFQGVLFDRLIACFRIRGNVGFFIVAVDFLGYLGTTVLLVVRSVWTAAQGWLGFYNQLAALTGLLCTALLAAALVAIRRRLHTGVPFFSLPSSLPLTPATS